MNLHLSQPLLRRLARALLVVLAGALIGLPARAQEAPPPFREGDRVAWIGDSITRGGLWHAFIQLFHATRYPGRRIDSFNAGRSGDAAPRTLLRLGWDVLERKPTVAVVMLGMNDIGGGFTAPGRDDAAITEAMRLRVEKAATDYGRLLAALDAAEVPSILVSPSPYDDTAELPRPADARRNDALALWTQRVRAIARQRRAAFVDVHGPMTALNRAAQARDRTSTLVGPDRIHPGPVGHFVMANLWLAAQGHGPTVARAVVDAGTASAETSNCRVTEIGTREGAVQFVYHAEALPFPVPREAAAALEVVPFVDDLDRETLVVKGLAAGLHGVWFGEEPIGVYSAARLAEGVNLATNPRTPQYRQAERVARANRQRHDVESGPLRGLAWVRSSILEPAHVSAGDAAGVERAFAAYRAKHPDPADFGVTMIKRWPEWVAGEAESAATLARLTEAMSREAVPVARRVSVRPVPATVGLDAQEVVDLPRRARQGDPAALAGIDAIRRRADQLLEQPPVSVMDKQVAAPSGDKHDYVSLATYYWPNPKTPDGLPYVARDGEVNPETKDSDYTRLRTMVDRSRGLALAFALTREDRYAQAAATQLRVWFLDAATRMHPHLDFGQCVRGRKGGSPFGIIESTYLTEALDAEALLADSPAWSAADHEALERWFRDYLAWLTDSELGQKEANDTNNHGTWYDVQAASFALFTGDEARAREIVRAARERRIAAQIEPDGTMPRELRRTKSAGYTYYNTRAMVRLARLGERLGIDLWNYQTPDGRGLRKALDFFSAYADPDTPWPHQQIEEFGRQGILVLLRQASSRYGDRPYGRLLDTLPSQKTRTSQAWLLGD